VVLTLNEEESIGECLAALAFAEEVLVVDSFSSDRTCEVARERGARVLQHQYLSPAAQRNWAIAQAEHEWVLMVDADEVVTEELAEEIREVTGTGASEARCGYSQTETEKLGESSARARSLARLRRTRDDRRRGPGDLAGYEMRRRNYFLGHEIRHCGWQNDWVMRLFRRELGHCPERQIHEQVKVEGPVGRLRGRLVHRSYRSMDDYWRRLGRYAEWNAREARGRGARVSLPRLMLHPPLRFLKAYLLQGGFLDGGPGLMVCLLTAVYAAAKDASIWAQQQREGGPKAPDQDRPAQPLGGVQADKSDG
jgi:glycosyltransferase involved in cell wall biosynthesis